MQEDAIRNTCATDPEIEKEALLFEALVSLPLPSVSPRTIIHVLDAVRRHPDFRVFFDALPVAGVDGTLENRMRGTPAQGNVHAKTGYIDKARSLSGYVTTADGRVLVFSALCNNYSVPTKAVERVQDALAVRLASLRLPVP